MSSSINNNNQMDVTNLLQQTNDMDNVYYNMIQTFFMQRFGDSFDYNSLLDDLHELNTVINYLLGESIELQRIILNDMTSNQILILLREYQNCLKKNLEQFIYIVEQLNQKNEGYGKYSFFKYNADRKTLAKYSQQLADIGNVLQVKAVPYMASARRAN